jgi:glycosyltransferase involved in cell wall biosynthesis
VTLPLKATPDVSIVVATYDRPASLEETLRSCLAQRNALGLSVEIVVIDNHPAEGGRLVAGRLQGGRFPIRYLTDLTRNMSTLRNRGFTEAKAPLVGFIDDDEVAAEDWLDQLVGALRDTGADVAVGPRLARFADGKPPAYDPTGAYFARDLHLPDRQLVALTNAAGKPQYGLGTGNSLFDMSSCFPQGEPPMREAFGDAGGEDAELFVRLHRQGRSIVWAAKAFVTETVAPHRTSIAYRLVRTRRETQHYVTIYMDGARFRPLVWLSLMAKGWIQLLAGAVLTAATGEFFSHKRIKGRLLMQHGLGKLSWRRPIGFISESNF